MGKVVVLGVESGADSAIVSTLKSFDDLGPWSTANVLEENDCRPVFLDPLQHPTECSPRLSTSVDPLLVIVQRRIIHTRRSGNEHIDISRHFHFGTIRRGPLRGAIKTESVAC